MNIPLIYINIYNIRDEYACLDLVAMLLVDVPYSIVVSSVRYSYIDISYIAYYPLY